MSLTQLCLADPFGISPAVKVLRDRMLNRAVNCDRSASSCIHKVLDRCMHAALQVVGHIGKCLGRAWVAVSTHALPDAATDTCIVERLEKPSCKKRRDCGKCMRSPVSDEMGDVALHLCQASS